MKPIQFEVCIKGETMSQQTVTFTINVVTAAQPFTVVDANGATIPDGATVPLADANVGQQSSSTLFTVSGGTVPYNFVVSTGAVPDGLALNATSNADGSETVTLDGTPTTAGNNSFALLISDSAGSAVKATVRKRVG